MKLELRKAGVIPGAWVMEINLRKIPRCIDIPPACHWSVWSQAMDAAFVLPFDCRRIGPWHKWDSMTYWAYVTLPNKGEK